MSRLRAIQGLAGATAYDPEIRLDPSNVFDVLINDEELSEACIETAADVVGKVSNSGNEQPARETFRI